MIKNYNVTVNGVSYEVEVEEVEKNNTNKSHNAISIVKNNTIDEKIQNKEKNESLKNVVSIDKNSNENIFSPMPGIVNKINVLKNQSVTRGQVLLILEAMKMENEIVSPIDGIIKDIHISEKDTVNSGELLISIE